ncbi:MAG: argininosuccinate synthase [Acidobacteriota bacterium]|nr:argininosuccinate synthase [Acidobacteriota bacterium]
MTERIVLAFSGGASSTAVLSRLADRPGADVVAVAVALGQGRELEGIRERALAAGARRCHVLDLEEAFARELVWPSVLGGADPALPPSALAAPLVARALLEIARVERAAEVAHGARGRAANRLQALLGSLEPAMRVLDAGCDEPAGRHVPGAAPESDRPSAAGPTWLDAEASFWGRRVTGAALADPWTEPPPDAFSLTRPPEDCPAEPARLEVRFDRGVPVALNGVPLPLVELLGSVDTIAGAHGVGRTDLVGVDDDGLVWREIREAPALTALRLAHEAIERMTAPAEHAAFRHVVGGQYTSLLRDGLWHSPARRALDAYVNAVQAQVSGLVRLSLFKGHGRVIGRRAEGYDRLAAPASADTGGRGPA